ncbi:hypothetical protein J1N35_023277 [Gossypium stocksii]|uniref:Uncharacterized protein n=1 Tax=Gossypium stocksii TaxID=47602 RepID=A0A9D3VIF8_9ROSI|nr:hypothetical protein J1N35_023277 [Gossypium stocksii]
MTKSTLGSLAFNSEIEKTTKANRKEMKLRKKKLEVVGTQSNLLPKIQVNDEVKFRVKENPTQTLGSERVGVDLLEEVLNARVNKNPN